MKIVVQLEPDDVELQMNEVDESDFIVDQDTFCHFRDDIFIKEMEEFIKNRGKNEWQETEGLPDYEKVNNWYKNQRLINKYYPKYNKNRQRFYLYKGNIYFYEFVGFMNVTNEIQLMLLEPDDIVELLNKSKGSLLSKILKGVGIA